MHKKLLEDGYSLIKQYKDGGQSSTSILKKDNTKYLLKQPLEKNISKEQKFRFEQEAKALELMNGNGTPKVFSYSFEDDPYILMEYIEGKTLADLVNEKINNLDFSVNTTFKILKILRKIHEIGLLHRDIKPDNIILNEKGDVFLIDFGLCRINDENKSFETPENKELGNRFLRLPELGKGEKIPSSVSDVTFVVGILFFMLFKHAPNQLLDEQGKPPHKRKPLELQSWMTYTFDKGFAYEISQRFQTAEELENFIKDQRTIKKEIIQIDPIAEFSKLVNTSDFRRKDDILKVLVEAHKEFIIGVNSVLSSELVTGGSGPNIQGDGYTVVTDFFIVRSGYSQPLSPYRLISVLNKELNSISFYSDVAGISVKSGTYSVSEKDRIINEYRDLGKNRAKEAVRNLIEMVKLF